MKIALYVPSWPPGTTPNGIVTYAAQLVPALRHLGHEVYVLTPHKASDEDPYTVDLSDFAPPRTFLRRAINRLLPHVAVYRDCSSAIESAVAILVQRNGVEILEIEESFGWSAEISTLNLIPVLVRLHGPWFLNGRFEPTIGGAWGSRSKIAAERRGIGRAAFVSAPYADVLNNVKTRYGLDLADSRVIPNPVQAASEAGMWSFDACRQNAILFVGRFDALKGGELVLRSFLELAPTYPDLTLTFVGPDIGITGPDGGWLSFEQFVQRYIPAEYRARIEYRGYMTPKEIAPLRRLHSITLIASRHEMAPYAVLEAMSLGCPIIATAVGGIPEQIHNGRNGLLVPSQDVAAMAAACSRLLDDTGLAARLGRQAWLDCRELYAPETIAEKTLAAYRRAIEKFASARAR